MSAAVRKTLHKSLKMLKVHVTDGTGPVGGICGYTVRTATPPEGFNRQDVALMLSQKIQEWPGSSGHPTYPVEGNGFTHEHDRKSGKLWQNPRRLELLDWLIKETSHG